MRTREDGADNVPSLATDAGPVASDMQYFIIDMYSSKESLDSHRHVKLHLVARLHDCRLTQGCEGARDCCMPILNIVRLIRDEFCRPVCDMR